MRYWDVTVVYCLQCAKLSRVHNVSHAWPDPLPCGSSGMQLHSLIIPGSPLWRRCTRHCLIRAFILSSIQLGG